MIRDGPVERLDDHVRAARATEHAHGVEIGLRRNARPDAEALIRCIGVVGARIRCAPGGHAEPGGRAADVTAVTVAVQRVRVGLWRATNSVGGTIRVLSRGVVVVAHEIGAALHLRRRRAEQGGVRGQLLRAVIMRCAVIGGRAGSTEVRVRVVETGVDDCDLDTFAVVARRSLPHRRRADIRDALRVCHVVHPDTADRDDARQTGERSQPARGNAHLDSVDRVLESREHMPSHRFDGSDKAGLLSPQRVRDGLLRALGDRQIGSLAADDCDRITGQLHDDRQRLVFRRRDSRRHWLRIDGDCGRNCICIGQTRGRRCRRRVRGFRHGNRWAASDCSDQRAKYADTSTNGCVHRKSPHQRCEKGFAPTSIGGPTYRLMDGGVVKRRRKTSTKLPGGRPAGWIKMTGEDKRFAGSVARQVP